MKNILIIFILFVIYLPISACGPSASEQQRAQQNREDSIKNAIETKYAMEEELKNEISSLHKMQTDLENAKATLEVEKDKLNKIKEFHVLRGTSDRELQIKNQSLIIQTLEDKIVQLSQSIDQIRKKVTSLKNDLQKYQ